MDVSSGGDWISAGNPFLWFWWNSMFGGGSSSGGSTSGSANDTGTGSEQQQTEEERALNQGIQDAKGVLDDASDECKALFNGKDPSDFLKELEGRNRIKIASSYKQYDEPSGKNVKTEFDAYTVGIAPTVQGALGFKYPMIFINEKGAFMTGVVQFLNGSARASEWFGIKPEQVAAFIILHELVHAAGRVHTRGDEQAFNEELRDKCFKKK
jgi:hypothetical protein